MSDYSKYIFNKRENVIINAGVGVLGIIVALAFYRNVIFALIILPFTKKIKSYVGSEMLLRRKKALMEQFKDFLFVLSTSIGAGRSMKEAIREAMPSISEVYGEDALLIRELKVMHRRMDAGNEDDVGVMMDFAVRTGQEDIIDFVTIYATCKITGASLLIALNRAASVIIEKMTVDREIREIVRRKESEGMVIFLMPLIVIIFLNLCAPDYIDPMYETWAGRIIMTAVAAANIGIYEIIRKVIRVDI